MPHNGAAGRFTQAEAIRTLSAIPRLALKEPSGLSFRFENDRNLQQAVYALNSLGFTFREQERQDEKDYDFRIINEGMKLEIVAKRSRAGELIDQLREAGLTLEDGVITSPGEGHTPG
jgi:hypothetical protein